MIPPTSVGYKEPQTQSDGITLGDTVKNGEKISSLKVGDENDRSEEYGNWKGKSEMGV